MDKEKEVKVGEKVVHPKGSLLTLTAQEAPHESMESRCWRKSIAESVDDLTRRPG